MSALPAVFAAGSTGEWRIQAVRPVRGEGLAEAPRLCIAPTAPQDAAPSWALRGVTSHARYTTRAERRVLETVQPALGRVEARCAALIPIRKSSAWWDLAQDERRAIFEERSRHIAIGLKYLPAVARRLYHSRDLGEPFDFLTWFEFAPQDANAFDDLVGMLRETEEWSFTEREVDIRLERDSGTGDT